MLTNCVKHLVTLIENKDSHAPKPQVFIPNQRVETTRRPDNDVRMRVFVLEYFGILYYGSASIKDTSLDVGHVFAEPIVLVANLESQLTCVAHDQYGTLAGNRFDLLQGRENEHSRFTETGFGLANNVTTKERLRNTGLLDCGYRWMLDRALSKTIRTRGGRRVRIGKILQSSVRPSVVVTAAR